MPVEQIFINFEHAGQKYILGATYIRPQSHQSYYETHVSTVEQLVHKHPGHKLILMHGGL